MNISYNWLKEYVSFDMTPEEVSAALTSIGLEVGSVEEVQTIKGGLEGIVIGEVLTCEEHPNSDHMHVTTVNLGNGEPVQIVCGAPNVAAGQKVVVATLGTKLYDGDECFTIKKSKLRGVESNGMICAEDEIGIGTSHDGIIVLPEEAKTLSADEINRRIGEAFVYDDYKWQYENKVVIDDPDRAKGLHAILYKCPRCGKEFETDSAGTELWCNACGARWEQDVYGRLHATDGGETVYEHIPDWTKWERECVREEVRNGTYYFEDNDARIETLPNWTKFYKHGHGRVIQTLEGTRVEVDSYYGGGPTPLFRPALDLDSMHIEYDYLGWGDCIDISVPKDSFWCYLSKRDQITKISFATEEIYFLAKEKAAARKKASAD